MKLEISHNMFKSPRKKQFMGWNGSFTGETGFQLDNGINIEHQS